MKKSIRTYFALLFALLALAPIAIIFAIYSPGVLRELNNRTMQDLQSLGKSNVNIISLWIEEKTMEVECLSRSHHVIAAVKGLPQDQEDLAEFLHSNLQEQGFLGIYVLDREGKLRASAERDEYAGLPKEAKQLLENALKDMLATLAHSHELEEAKDKRLTFSIASPILVGTDALGAVVAHLDLSKLKEALMSVIGERKGCASIIDKEGMMLLCFMLDPSSECYKSMGKKLVDPRTGNLTPVVKACLSGKEGFSMHEYTHRSGEEVFVAWRWLPELGAGILVEINAQEFFEPVSLVKRRLWSLLLIVGVGIITVSIFVGRRVSEPGGQTAAQSMSLWISS